MATIDAKATDATDSNGKRKKRNKERRVENDDRLIDGVTAKSYPTARESPRYHRKHDWVDHGEAKL